jgi:hypothetical protein
VDGFSPFGTLRRVEVDLLTDAYRIAGTVETRFGRVTDILNQLPGSHLHVTEATVSEHADPTATMRAPSLLVAASSILVLVAPGLTGDAGGEMRIEKRPVKVQLGLPPLRVTGTMHVPPGSIPTDGLLNMTDRFLTMTDATIASGAYPQLERAAGAVAVCRERAQVLLVAGDETPDEVLAEVLDEGTADAWLPPDEELPEGDRA